MKHKQGKTRRVDKLANPKGGLMNALKRRRQAVEKGTIEGLQEAPQTFVTAIGGTGHKKR